MTYEIADMIAFARTKFARLPLVVVEEMQDTFDPDAFQHDDLIEICIDLEKVAEQIELGGVVVGSLRYVDHIIDAALNGKGELLISRKSSFGDTPDWWDTIVGVPTEGRIIVRITTLVA